MKVYAIFDWTNGDWFENVYESEEAAIQAANREWDNMTTFDKNRRQQYFVGTCSYDDDGSLDYDTIVVIKQYK